jgi:hypothetical protein
LGWDEDRNNLFRQRRGGLEVGNCQIHKADRLKGDGDVAVEVAHRHGRNTAEQDESKNARCKNTQGTGIFLCFYSWFLPRMAWSDIWGG